MTRRCFDLVPLWMVLLVLVSTVRRINRALCRIKVKRVPRLEDI